MGRDHKGRPYNLNPGLIGNQTGRNSDSQFSIEHPSRALRRE